MNEFISEEKFIVIQCASCGISFAVTNNFKQRRLNDHNTFYCPTGHSNYYAQESDIDKANRLAREAQEKTNRLQKCIDHKKDIIKRQDYVVRHFKGEVTKLKSKIYLKTSANNLKDIGVPDG